MEAEEIIRKEKYNSLNNLVLICEAMDEYATELLKEKDEENTRLKEQHKSEMLEEYHKGYGEGYADATSEAIREIQKNYEPKQ